MGISLNKRLYWEHTIVVIDKEMKWFILGRQNDNISMWHSILKEIIIEEEC